jgi:hypothetical protein
MNKVRAELVTILKTEIKNLEHEIQLHRQAGANYSGDALVSAETQLIAAREILSGN